MIQKFVIVINTTEEITEAQLGGLIMDAFKLNLIRVDKVLSNGTPVPAYIRKTRDLTDEKEG